jgi:hypothetical protein
VKIFYHQDTKTEGRWKSEEIEVRERHHAVQGVIAGFLFGEPRWATDAVTGEFIYGLDKRGAEIQFKIQAWNGEQLVSDSAYNVISSFAHGVAKRQSQDNQGWTLRIMASGADYCEIWKAGERVRAGTFAETTLVHC